MVGAFTTATNSIGSNQIPQLTGVGGVLPESGITIRDYYFVIEGNTSVNNTATDFTISTNIDSGTAFAFATIENALASDCFRRFIGDQQFLILQQLTTFKCGYQQ
ncbi:MAG: hypothetical protein U5K51_03505 [Flavobacteriaceae bacterium]|nr:hypothetical protein [Flavobacteriaceae bacterium]